MECQIGRTQAVFIQSSRWGRDERDEGTRGVRRLADFYRQPVGTMARSAVTERPGARRSRFQSQDCPQMLCRDCATSRTGIRSSVTDEAGEGGRRSVVCWRVASSQAHPRSPTFSLAHYAASVTPRIAGGTASTCCSPDRRVARGRGPRWCRSRTLMTMCSRSGSCACGNIVVAAQYFR